MSSADQSTRGSASKLGAEAEPGEDVRGRLAQYLLPTLLHGVNNHTQFLTGLHAVLALASDGRVLHDRAEDLAETAREVEDAGWLLALIASGSGTNLMLARRESRGLEIVANCVDQALRREGATRIASCASRPWPALAPGALDGWQLPWVIGSLLLAAGLDAPRTEAYEWSLRPVGEAAASALFVLPFGPRVEQLIPLVAEMLAGARIDATGGELQLTLPGAWLLFAAARP